MTMGGAVPGQIAKRNSSLELLRVISALMICARHIVGNNLDAVASMPLSINKILLQALVYGGGKVGVVCFFLITAWFICGDDSLSMKKTAHRAWNLWVEVVFWSIAFFLFCCVTGLGDLSIRYAIGTLFPLCMEVWWYPTSYVLFLLFAPFVTSALHALGKEAHGRLVALCILLWGGVALLPGVTLDMEVQSVFVMLYLYVIASWIRWYGRVPSARTCWALIGVGALVACAGCLVTNVAAGWVPLAARHATWIVQNEWMLPVTMMGFGLFFLALGQEYHSRVINTLARGAFVSYLLTSYPPLVATVIGFVAPAVLWINSPAAVPLTPLLSVPVYFAACLLEVARRLLFKAAVDPWKGTAFERLYRGTISTKAYQRIKRTIDSSDGGCSRLQ